MLSWLLIDTGRKRNGASIFFLFPTFKIRSFNLMSAVRTSKYHYHNTAR
jgi:hypothetical protein